MRALHAEGANRGYDHGELHDLARAKFGAESMGALDLGQLKTFFADLAGRNFRVRRKTVLPRRGCAARGADLEMVGPEDLETLANAFAVRQWGAETRAEFIRRQLGGREQIRTRGDFWRVFSGVRAMNRRDGLLKTGGIACPTGGGNSREAGAV